MTEGDEEREGQRTTQAHLAVAIAQRLQSAGHREDYRVAAIIDAVQHERGTAEEQRGERERERETKRARERRSAHERDDARTRETKRARERRSAHERKCVGDEARTRESA